MADMICNEISETTMQRVNRKNINYTDTIKFKSSRNNISRDQNYIEKICRCQNFQIPVL